MGDIRMKNLLGGICLLVAGSIIFWITVSPGGWEEAVRILLIAVGLTALIVLGLVLVMQP